MKVEVGESPYLYLLVITERVSGRVYKKLMLPLGSGVGKGIGNRASREMEARLCTAIHFILLIFLTCECISYLKQMDI